MATGLIALLDDVAAIAKVTAASLDDVAAQTVKAGSKAAGVTPRFVVGIEAERELAIIWRIAMGSLRNKIVFLLPGALLLSAFLPWAITPLLMLGGLYLAYEGAEKLIHLFQPSHTPHGEGAATATNPKELEDQLVAGAIRTDFILSAEIMAISLATIEAPDLLTRAIVLAAVGVLITVAVYGAVALIVKADDLGAAMVLRGGALRAVGRVLVVGMPKFLALLSIVGTVAMLWVGGGILIHGLATFGWHAPEELIHDFAHTLAVAMGPLEAAADWLLRALASAVVGFVLGAVVLGVLSLVRPQSAHA